jgi:predicted nucleic acid-binding protein
MTRVFLDANVLYSNTLRSLFIWLHKDRVIEVFWSMEVWEEAFAAFTRNNDAEKAHKFRASMIKNAITLHTECLVRVPEHSSAGLSDPNDEHVVAAAIESGSDYLVTNDKPLLQDALRNHDIKQIRPDDLISKLLIGESPAGVIRSVHDHIASLTNSRPSIAYYLTSLENAGLAEFASWLNERNETGKLFSEVWLP